MSDRPGSRGTPLPSVDSLPKATVLEMHGYQVGKNIGSGSYATVKEAVSSKHKCKVAIKIISKTRAPDDYLRKFLPREIDVIKYLRHPSLVLFYQCIETTNRMYLIMELAPKGDLLDEIRGKKHIPEAQAAFWFAQLTNGIEYIHEKGVVHRDLKCENLILDARNNLKITDFGFARAGMKPKGGQYPLSETYCGSYAYAPPEILTGTPYPPQMADIWSSGVILYVMVVGRLPFDDSNHKELVRQVTKRGPQFPSTPEVSKECQDLIVKMLVKISKRLTVPEIKSHVWFIKLAPSPREQAQALSPDDPKKVMSNNKVIKTTSTGAKVNKSRTGRRPSGSAPKMSNSKEKSADSEKKSSSYGQKINSRDPVENKLKQGPSRDHHGGNTADNPSIKAGTTTKSKTPEEYLSVISVS